MKKNTLDTLFVLQFDGISGYHLSIGTNELMAMNGRELYEEFCGKLREDDRPVEEQETILCFDDDSFWTEKNSEYSGPAYNEAESEAYARWYTAREVIEMLEEEIGEPEIDDEEECYSLYDFKKGRRERVWLTKKERLLREINIYDEETRKSFCAALDDYLK